MITTLQGDLHTLAERWRGRAQVLREVTAESPEEAALNRELAEQFEATAAELIIYAEQRSGPKAPLRTLDALLAEIGAAAELLKVHPPQSAEWLAVSVMAGVLHDELVQRTNAELGRAFAATLMKLAERDLDVSVVIGERLAAELRERRLIVIPGGGT